jgi:hypothetical protein
MSNDNLWKEELDKYLSDSKPSPDTKFLARVLSTSESQKAQDAEQDLSALERALHIEANLDEIGLQDIPVDLQERLKSIPNKQRGKKVVWLDFSTHWKKLGSIAACLLVVSLVFTLQVNQPKEHVPTLAEIKQAEKDLKLALEYLSIAQAKSSIKVKQTLNEHVKAPFEESLLIPLDHIKES